MTTMEPAISPWNKPNRCRIGALDWQIAYPIALLRLALKAVSAWAEQSIDKPSVYMT